MNYESTFNKHSNNLAVFDQDHFRLDIGARQVRGAAWHHVPEGKAVVGFPEIKVCNSSLGARSS